MRAVRITQANWLNDEVGGDAGTVKLMSDAMAYDAVEIWGIGAYAPEYDGTYAAAPAQETTVQAAPEVIDFPAEEPSFVGPEAAAARMEALQEMVTDTEAAGLYNEAPAEAEVPEANASKAAWIDWAVQQGCEPKQAAVYTKAQLMSKYGERL